MNKGRLRIYSHISLNRVKKRGVLSFFYDSLANLLNPPQRSKYSFLRLAGATMIMDISIKLILTTARPSGKPNIETKKIELFYIL